MWRLAKGVTPWAMINWSTEKDNLTVIRVVLINWSFKNWQIMWPNDKKACVIHNDEPILTLKAWPYNGNGMKCNPLVSIIRYLSKVWLFMEGFWIYQQLLAYQVELIFFIVQWFPYIYLWFHPAGSIAFVFVLFWGDEIF